MSDTRFKERQCPCCGNSERTRLFELAAARFCVSNWTYASDYPAILGISPDKCFPIARCCVCGFVYAELEPDATFLAKVYDEVISHEANIAANENLSNYASRMRCVADLLDLAPSHTFHNALDYGCGLGITLRLLESTRVRCVGFDISGIRTRYLANTRIKVAGNYDELRTEGPYDLIICENVLEHLSDPTEAIGFLASVAVEGAVLYVSVPDCNSSFIKAQRLADQAGLALDMSLNPWEHLNYFDLSHLDQMLERARFLPVPELDLPGVVNIGLRPEKEMMQRLKNACATGIRLVRYALHGQTVRSPIGAYYRFKG